MLSLLRALRAAVLVYAVGAAVLWSQLLRRLRRGFREPALPRQPDRVAIVTGGTDGIGLATARQLARLGMRVVIAGNNTEKAQDVVSSLRAQTGNDKVDFLFCDLASLTSVRKFVRDFLSQGYPLHVLVNNAGVMLVPQGTTEDGFENHFGLNFLGHFLLTNLLLGALRDTGTQECRSRVVTVSSSTHYVGELDPAHLEGSLDYSPHAAYACSKLALVVFSRRLQRLLAARGDLVTANVADPGVVDTALFSHTCWVMQAVQWALGWLLFKTPDEGAWTTVYAAAAPELEGVGGCYMYNEEAVEPLRVTWDQTLQDQLWVESCRLTGILDETGAGLPGP
ncbi:hypothetical protein STEG23_025810 [Scotinomys teguina]